MKDVLEFLMVALCLAALLLLGFWLGRKTAPEPEVQERIIRDTVRVREPYCVTKRVTDTVRISVRDTVRVRDTLYVQLPREQVTWEDSLARVYASGVMPQVDSVEHFITTRYVVTETVKKTRWGVGISGGVGVGKGGFTPYIGIGVQYNILCF